MHARDDHPVPAEMSQMTPMRRLSTRRDHRHVATCPVLTQMGLQDRVHHPDDWQLVSRQAKIVRLRQYLDTLPEGPRQHALLDCERELLDLGIDPVS